MGHSEHLEQIIFWSRYLCFWSSLLLHLTNNYKYARSLSWTFKFHVSLRARVYGWSCHIRQLRCFINCLTRRKTNQNPYHSIFLRISSCCFVFFFPCKCQLIRLWRFPVSGKDSIIPDTLFWCLMHSVSPSHCYLWFFTFSSSSLAKKNKKPNTNTIWNNNCFFKSHKAAETVKPQIHPKIYSHIFVYITIKNE